MANYHVADSDRGMQHGHRQTDSKQSEAWIYKNMHMQIDRHIGRGREEPDAAGVGKKQSQHAAAQGSNTEHRGRAREVGRWERV